MPNTLMPGLSPADIEQYYARVEQEKQSITVPPGHPLYKYGAEAREMLYRLTRHSTPDDYDD
jgi:hypothetical protein